MKHLEIKVKILPILKRSGVKHSALFGSTARGDNREESDIDLLVEMDKSSTLFDFIELKQNLEEALGKKVDLLTIASLNPKLKKYIEKDSINIL